MRKINNSFYCFIIGVGFMIVTAINKNITYSSIIPKEILENINYIFYKVGYILSIVFGCIVLIQVILNSINNKNLN